MGGWAAAFSPLAFLAVGLAVAAAAGSLPSAGEFALYSGWPAVGIAGAALAALLNGFGEEPGWRGFLLPALQTPLRREACGVHRRRNVGVLASPVLPLDRQPPRLWAVHAGRVSDRDRVRLGGADLAVLRIGAKHPGRGRLARDLQHGRGDRSILRNRRRSRECPGHRTSGAAHQTRRPAPSASTSGTARH